mmetsp:Transcript_77259/g.221297  ORF Transcript_77259/g.221297 Transcript_77259/m.221297 type:complete len:269 (+) Transcript_77259:109-915(+)
MFVDGEARTPSPSGARARAARRLLPQLSDPKSEPLRLLRGTPSELGDHDAKRLRTLAPLDDADVAEAAPPRLLLLPQLPQPSRRTQRPAGGEPHDEQLAGIAQGGASPSPIFRATPPMPPDLPLPAHHTAGRPRVEEERVMTPTSVASPPTSSSNSPAPPFCCEGAGSTAPGGAPPPYRQDAALSSSPPWFMQQSQIFPSHLATAAGSRSPCTPPDRVILHVPTPGAPRQNTCLESWERMAMTHGGSSEWGDGEENAVERDDMDEDIE